VVNITVHPFDGVTVLPATELTLPSGFADLRFSMASSSFPVETSFVTFTVASEDTRFDKVVIPPVSVTVQASLYKDVTALVVPVTSEVVGSNMDGLDDALGSDLLATPLGTFRLWADVVPTSEVRVEVILPRSDLTVEPANITLPAGSMPHIPITIRSGAYALEASLIRFRVTSADTRFDGILVAPVTLLVQASLSPSKGVLRLAPGEEHPVVLTLSEPAPKNCTLQFTIGTGLEGEPVAMVSTSLMPRISPSIIFYFLSCARC
jgi:hypothetical protein